MIDFEKQTEQSASGPSPETASLPEAFLTRMQGLLTNNEYAAFLSTYGQKRRYSLRINPLKTDREKALQRLLQSASAASGTMRSDAAGTVRSDADSIPDQEGLHPVLWEPDGLYYPEWFRPGRLPWHEAGMYYIQEASAMAPAVLCDAQPGERVLDLCAAPGGKSTKLAASLQGRGLLVANEIHPERARVLSSNLERMGVRNALVTNESPQRLASRFPRFFDRIVVDAPCSGEGMFRKEEEALVQWSPENVRMCARRQMEILEEAASMLRPGGRLVYSTCTFSPEENEGVIFRFLMEHPDFSVVSIPDLPGIRAEEWGFACGRPEWIPKEDVETAEAQACAEQIRGTIRLWPQLLEGEGHFAAVLRKGGRGQNDKNAESKNTGDMTGGHQSFPFGNGSSALSVQDSKHGKRGLRKDAALKKKRSGKRGGKTDSKREEAIRLWDEFCHETLNLLPVEKAGREEAAGLADGSAGTSPAACPRENLLLFGEVLYALPLPADILPLEGLRVLRPGLQLGDISRGRFLPSHALGMALREDEVLRTVSLPGDSPEAYAWLRGEAVSLPEGIVRGWCLVCIDDCAAGWGKAAGSMLKNHYPKGLRKGSSYRPG